MTTMTHHPNDTRYANAVRLLALIFAASLREEVGEAVLGEINRRNRRSLDPRVCHSHSWTDANVIMAEAFREVTGEEADPGDAEHAALWNDAWSYAKDHSFNVWAMQMGPNGELRVPGYRRTETGGGCLALEWVASEETDAPSVLVVPANGDISRLPDAHEDVTIQLTHSDGSVTRWSAVPCRAVASHLAEAQRRAVADEEG